MAMSCHRDRLLLEPVWQLHGTDIGHRLTVHCDAGRMCRSEQPIRSR
ncbi:MAG: hypothetical protein RLZ94_650, partial [Actinomycetota bacterium]